MQGIGWRSIGVLAFVVAGCAGEPLSEEDVGVLEQQAVLARACSGILPPAPPAAASVVTLQAGATDATISAAAPTTRLGNQALCIAASGANERSCLLRFDLSSIPSNALVHGAELTFTAKDLGGKKYRIHKMLKDWSELGVTWNRYTSESLWSTPGAKGFSDRGDTICEFTGETGRLSYALNTALIATIQSWVDGATNSGLGIETTDAPAGLLALQSSEVGVDVPQLKVWYSPFSVRLAPTASTTIKQSTPTKNFAQETTCVAKRVGLNGVEEACLLRWDLSVLPPNTEVTSVVFELVHPHQTSRYDILGLKKPWTELEATWLNYAASSPWGAAGAKSGADVSPFADLITSTASPAFRKFTMSSAAVPTVQAWVSDPASNMGVIVAPWRAGPPQPALVLGNGFQLFLRVGYR